MKKRERDLLLLLLEQDSFQSARFFKDRLGVSTKTIYADLDGLELIAKENHLQIQRVPRRGVFLSGKKADKEALQSHLTSYPQVFHRDFSPRQRQLFIFSAFLFSKEVKHYKDFAEAFFVSPQSIKKDVDEIALFCRSHGVHAFMSQTGFQLEGSEQEIQKTFKLYVEQYEKNRNEAFLGSELIAPSVENLTKDFLKQVENRSDRVLSSHSLRSFWLSLVIFLSRLAAGKHIDSTGDFLFKDLKKYQLYILAVEFSENVTRSIGAVLQISDLYYLCSLFLAHGVVPYILEKESNTAFKTAVANLIAVMVRLLGVNFSKDAYLFHSLLSHIVPMIHRLRNGISISNPLKDHIKRQYATMFMMIQFAISSLETEFHIQLTEDEISFLTIHFQVALEKIRTTKHVLIVCSKGLATSQLIFQRIQQRLPESVVLEIVSEDRVSAASLNGVDLIISTVPLESTDIPVIHVSPLPSSAEMSRISALLSNINEGEKTFTTPRYQNLKLLEKHLCDDFLFVKQTAPSKKAVLDALILQHEKAGIVHLGFRQSVYDRENQWSTEIAEGAAMPHADPSTVKKTTISFYALEQPVHWGSFPVQLVIMLAIAEEDIEEAKNLVSLLSDLLYSKEAILHIASSASKEELQMRLLEEVQKTMLENPKPFIF